MKRGLLTFTYVMFGISVLFALLLLVFALLSLIIMQIVPPVVVFTVLTCPFVLLSLHYIKCIKAIRHRNDWNNLLLKKLTKTNSGLAIIFVIFAVNTLLVALYPLVFYGSEILLDDTYLFFFVYFLCVCSVSTLYTINLLLHNKEFGKTGNNHCSGFSHDDQNILEAEMKLITLQHYTFQSKGKLANIVDDAITYSVLRKILHFTCTDIFTNDKSVVICYSNAPYPVWVWCKKPFSKQDVQSIAHTLKNHYLTRGNYRFIISEDLLAELTKADEIFGNLTVKMELLSYELRDINKIGYPCSGQMQKATMEQLDKLALMHKDACYEMEMHDFTMEHCKSTVMEMMQNDNLYIWVDDENQIVATVTKSIDSNYAKISFVYTLPNYRRKGYAINFVHKLSQMLIDDGFTPILYTNGNYVASNACYQKIGYQQIGKLVNVENNE